MGAWVGGGDTCETCAAAVRKSSKTEKAEQCLHCCQHATAVPGAGPTAAVAHLWLDVPEGQCLVIFIDDGGRDLLGHNLVEQSGAVTVCLPAGMEGVCEETRTFS